MDAAAAMVATASEQKARLVACGDVLRRVIGTVVCRRYDRKLEDYFQPKGQCGVAVSDGIETTAPITILSFEKGCTTLSYDGASASVNSSFSDAICRNLYARKLPQLLFALDGGEVEMVKSARGV